MIVQEIDTVGFLLRIAHLEAVKRGRIKLGGRANKLVTIYQYVAVPPRHRKAGLFAGFATTVSMHEQQNEINLSSYLPGTARK